MEPSSQHNGNTLPTVLTPCLEQRWAAPISSSSALWHTILFIINFLAFSLYSYTFKTLHEHGDLAKPWQQWWEKWAVGTHLTVQHRNLKGDFSAFGSVFTRQVGEAWDSRGGTTHQLTRLVNGSRPSANEPFLKGTFKCLAIVFGMHIRLPLVKRQTGNIKSTLPKEKNINRDEDGHYAWNQHSQAKMWEPRRVNGFLYC